MKNAEIVGLENLTPEEKWERATLANNFIFYKVMREHPEACRRLVEILLQIKIERAVINAEEIIAVDPGSKGVRLDVFVKSAGKMFDVEVQVANTRELPERSRYYQALMDLDTLKAGQQYSELRDSHVIFICMEDIFKNALPINTFENICIEDGKTKLRDRAYKHFFIAPICAKMLADAEAKAFFDFLISNRATSGYTKDLKAYVAAAKLSSQNKRQFMEWSRQRVYDFNDGRRAQAVEAARNFAANGVSEKIIAKSLNMSVEEIKEIIENSPPEK